MTSLLFAKAGGQLLSCSADRTVVVREAIRRNDDSPALFVITRTVTLKNSPTSMRPSLYDDVILLSATDRCIQLVNVQTGRTMSSFKASDAEGGDAVVMASLVHLPSSAGPPVVAGVSSSDKSVRLYSEDGTLLARDWGHTEGVTDIAVMQPSGAPNSSAKIVTVAADGTIFVWDTVPGRPTSSDSDQGLQVPGSGPGSAHPPLRKVISQSELARFQRSQSTDVNENEPPSPSTATPIPFKTLTSLRHKTSRLTVKATPRLDPSPSANQKTFAGGSHSSHGAKSKRRSPSPPSPLRARISAHVRNRSSTSGSTSASNTDKSSGAAHKAEAGGFGSASASTEQLCRTLKLYRQRLEKSSASVPRERLSELDNELDLTLALMQKTLGRKREGTVELDTEPDSISVTSQSSWTEAGATEEQRGDDDATPRRQRVNSDELAGPVCASPQDVSFGSAESHHSASGLSLHSDVEASGGA